MAQDFAKRSKSRSPKQLPRRFSLGSFLAGVFTGVGLFLLGAYGPELLQTLNPSAQPAGTVDQTAPAAAASDSPPVKPGEKPAGPGADESPDLEFVFRDLLGADRVDPDLSAYAADVQSQQPQTARQPMQYLLQSGSFQIRADAESRRGTLLLLNLPANIVEAQIDNKIWYRVIVGPYAQRGQAQQAVTRLRANDISAIWLERPVT